MARITRGRNEKKNTNVKIWVIRPDKDTEKKFYMPVKKQIKTKVTTKI